MRTIAYVDGFNLYHAIRPLKAKWLNLPGLMRAVLTPDHKLQCVKYYTARVSGAVDPGQPRRQQIYLNALATTGEVEVHFGNFLANMKWRPIVNLPVEGRQITGPGGVNITLGAGDYTVEPLAGEAKSKRERLTVGHHHRKGDPHLKPTQPSGALVAYVHNMEEKGSDVNLACHLVNDAHRDRFDVAAVLTNDTDLVEPIRIVTQELGKRVVLLTPPGRGGAHKALKAVASGVVHMHNAHVVGAQFPNSIADPAGGPSIDKPPEWA